MSSNYQTEKPLLMASGIEELILVVIVDHHQHHAGDSLFFTVSEFTNIINITVVDVAILQMDAYLK